MTSSTLPLASSALVDLHEIEGLLAHRLEILKRAGRSPDSSDFLRACAEIRTVLADGLHVIESRRSRPTSTPKLGVGCRAARKSWGPPCDDAITLELALALDRFLLDAAEELS